MPPCRALIVACLLLLASSSLCLAQDTSCGIIWDDPILLSDTSFDAHSPKIALSGDDTVHMTWWSVARFGTSDVRLPYCSSIDGGATLQGPFELLPDSIAFPGYAYTPSIVAEGSNVYMFFVGSTAGKTPVRMIVSTNAGADWGGVADISPDTCGIIQSVAIHGDTLALVYPYPFTRKILRSTNRGATWTRTNEALNYYTQVALSKGGVLHLVHEIETAGSRETEYRRSHDLGDTWVQTEVISTVDVHHSLDLAIAAEDTLLVAAWRDGKYGCLGPLGCSIIARNGMLHSDSTVWDQEKVATETPRGFAPAPSLRRGRVAVGWVDEHSFSTYHAGLRLTSDGDTSWCPAVDVTPTTDYTVGIVDVALSTKAVHVLWEQSVAPDPSTFRIFYRRGRFITTGVEEAPEHPSSALLGQNYPNPFNSSTRISYRINGEGKVSLKVYDMLGREIMVLVDEWRDIGEHATAWNADGLPSGVYFYRLIAGTKIETKKAILLK